MQRENGQGQQEKKSQKESGVRTGLLDMILYEGIPLRVPVSAVCYGLIVVSSLGLAAVYAVGEYGGWTARPIYTRPTDGSEEQIQQFV